MVEFVFDEIDLEYLSWGFPKVLYIIFADVSSANNFQEGEKKNFTVEHAD